MSAIDAIRDRYRREQALERQIEDLRAVNRDLQATIQYLQGAVDLLSLPRVTEADVRAVRDGLLALTAPRETVQ